MILFHPDITNFDRTSYMIEFDTLDQLFLHISNLTNDKLIEIEKRHIHRLFYNGRTGTTDEFCEFIRKRFGVKVDNATNPHHIIIHR